MSKNLQIKTLQAKLDRLAMASGRSSMQMQTLFLLERAAARMMSDPELQNKMIFKGGFISLRVYGFQRFTTDIDAVITSISSEEAIQRIKLAMAIDMNDGAWFEWEKNEDIKAQSPYGGLSIKYRCGLGEKLEKIERALQIGIDLGIGDPVTPSAVRTSTPDLIGEGEISWQIYPIETMIAEKLHALIVNGSRNSRSKDIYDLNLFLPRADVEVLEQAIKSTFEFRKTPVPLDFGSEIEKIDMTILKRGWPNISRAVKDVTDFETAVKALLANLERIH